MCGTVVRRPFVDVHRAVAIERDADLGEPEPRRRRGAPIAAIARSCSMPDRSSPATSCTPCARAALDLGDKVRIEAAQDPVAAVDERDVDAESREDVRELDAM